MRTLLTRLQRLESETSRVPLPPPPDTAEKQRAWKAVIDVLSAHYRRGPWRHEGDEIRADGFTEQASAAARRILVGSPTQEDEAVLAALPADALASVQCSAAVALVAVGTMSAGMGAAAAQARAALLLDRLHFDLASVDPADTPRREAWLVVIDELERHYPRDTGFLFTADSRAALGGWSRLRDAARRLRAGVPALVDDVALKALPEFQLRVIGMDAIAALTWVAGIDS